MGAVSLGIQAFELFGSCLKGYQGLLQACDMNSDLSVLRCRLELGTQRFCLWAEASDIESGNLDVPARHAPAVLSALECLQKLLTGQSSQVFENHQKELDKTDSWTWNASEMLLSISRHARWILSDKNKVESMINDIKAINDSLVSLLGQSKQAEASRSFQEMFIRVLGAAIVSRT